MTQESIELLSVRMSMNAGLWYVHIGDKIIRKRH